MRGDQINLQNIIARSATTEPSPQIRSGGTAVVLVEQDIARALRAADRFYCLQEGRVTLSGKPDDVDQDTIRAAYFGA